MAIASDPLTIAKWFLNKQPMTLKKLQTLMFYSYGNYLLFNNQHRWLIEKLFNEKIILKNGFIFIKSVADYYQKYGSDVIRSKKTIDKKLLNKQAEVQLEVILEETPLNNGMYDSIWNSHKRKILELSPNMIGLDEDSLELNDGLIHKVFLENYQAMMKSKQKVK